jgi:hypothetical protein
MEIQTGSVSSTISLASIVRATSGQGKISFPVSSIDMAYANFKNINIIPSNSDGGTYSVSRLRALDNLIEQLNRMKGQNKIETPELNKLDKESMDSLILNLSEEIHTRLESKSVFKPSFKTTGLLFNMLL